MAFPKNESSIKAGIGKEFSKVRHQTTQDATQDDFPIVNDCYDSYFENLQNFKEFANFIGLLMAPDKMFLPTQVMTFLGVELDRNNMLSHIPHEHLSSYKNAIYGLLGKSEVTLKELLSVTPPGRPFLHRLIDGTCSLKHPFQKNKF